MKNKKAILFALLISFATTQTKDTDTRLLRTRDRSIIHRVSRRQLHDGPPRRMRAAGRGRGNFITVTFLADSLYRLQHGLPIDRNRLEQIILHLIGR